MPVKGLFSKQQPARSNMKVMESHTFLIILILGDLHSSVVCTDQNPSVCPHFTL